MKNGKSHCVYMLTSPDGKSYIGTTGRKLSARWNNGKGYKECPLINEAIEKYGWDKFKKTILENNLSESEAYEREKYWVETYKTNLSEFGYNLTTGGKKGYRHGVSTKKKISSSHMGIRPSDDTRKRLSEIARNRPPMTQETKDKIRRANKGKKLNLTDEQRKRRSEHSRQYVMSEKNKELNRQRALGNTYRRKAVMCVETGAVFDTQYSASESIGRSKHCVAMAVKTGGTAGGYHWKQI